MSRLAALAQVAQEARGEIGRADDHDLADEAAPEPRRRGQVMGEQVVGGEQQQTARAGPGEERAARVGGRGLREKGQQQQAHHGQHEGQHGPGHGLAELLEDRKPDVQDREADQQEQGGGEQPEVEIGDVLRLDAEIVAVVGDVADEAGRADQQGVDGEAQVADHLARQPVRQGAERRLRQALQQPLPGGLAGERRGDARPAMTRSSGNAGGGAPAPSSSKAASCSIRTVVVAPAAQPRPPATTAGRRQDRAPQSLIS